MNESIEQLKSYHFFTILTMAPFVDEIILYGSRARGDNTPGSDFDLAIVCPRASDKDWQFVETVAEARDTLLGVDVVRFDKLKEDDPLKKDIKTDGITVFKR